MENALATQTIPPKMVNSYVNNQLVGLTSGQLLLKVYDIAIIGCQQQDGNKAIRAISELISSLNFDYQEISVGLFRLYQYIIDQIRDHNFSAAMNILKELRNAWATAMNESNY